MPFAEFVERHRGIVSAVSMACLLVAGYVIFRTLTSKPGHVTQRYFSTDDGATWFADSVDKMAPFMHDGKKAVWVHVFNCDGKPTAGYLERLSAASQAALAKMGNDNASTNMMLTTEVKKPGAGTWMPSGTRQGAEVASSPCPGTGRAKEIRP